MKKVISERCFLCAHWDGENCKRVLKVKMVLAQGAGSIDVETQPGLIPEYLETELNMWLADSLTQAVDSWPGWKEIEEFRKGNPVKTECPAREERSKVGLHIVKFDG